VFRAQQSRGIVLALIVGGAVVRVALGSLIGLSVDESYAVVMSRHLALSYYDHPPLLFWIPGVAARLAGSEGEFVVRLPFIAMFMGSTWLLYRLGALLFDERAGLWAAVALNLALFFTLNAASWVLPDGPLLFWSAAAALCLARATSSPPDLRLVEGDASGPPALLWWLGFGFFSGLALLSKYHGVFVLAGGALFLVTSSRHRGWLRRREPYLAVAIAAMVFLPVVIWNSDHDWASFRFQGGRAVPFEGEHDTPLLGAIAGQAAWMLPWVWVPLLSVLVSALRRGPRDSPRWLLFCLAIGPIAFFTLVAALGRRGLPHWEAPGYFMLLPLLGASIAARLQRGDPWVRRWLWASCAGLAAVLLVIVTQVSNGWVGDVAPALLAKGDPTDDLLQWEPVATQLREWGYPRPEVAIAAVTWADAAKLAYALGPRIEVGSVGGDPRGFEYLQSQRSLVGRDVLLVARRRPGMMEPMVVYAQYFERITGLGTIPILRHGRAGIAVSVYVGRRLLRPVPERRAQ
jgi:4-amino-4-deoxy-L-arabinose transferase-like glycosyltransferase